MTDGTPRGEIDYAGWISLIGINAEGSRLVVLARGPDDVEEKKKTPKDLKGAEKTLFKHQHDGRTSVITEYEIPSGKPLKEEIVFYSPGSVITMLVGEQETLILTYGNDNGLWADGKITPVRIEEFL